MRKGLALLAPFALIAGLQACSSSSSRQTFQAAAEPAPSGSGFGATVAPPPGDAGTQGCSESQTQVSRIPVVIEFVVDESGSMDGTGADNKWAAARDALLAAFDDMKGTADPATFVGALRFGSDVGDSVKPESLSVNTHYDRLVDMIDTPTAGGGGTATEDALTEAYDIVEDFKPPTSTGLTADGMKRIVVLLSDGAPNGGATEQAACENMAAQKFGAQPPYGPILTFAVGIGPFPSTSSFGYDPAFMGRLAVKGGTAPANCAPNASVLAGVCHYQVTPGQNINATKQALVAAINQIRALSTSCEFTFTTNESTDLGNVKVVITDKDGNETPIPQDPENGWSFDDDILPTKVILNGDACFASGGTVSGRVDVVIGCKGAN